MGTMLTPMLASFGAKAWRRKYRAIQVAAGVRAGAVVPVKYRIERILEARGKMRECGTLFTG
jgi:hypothetical protein